MQKIKSFLRIGNGEKGEDFVIVDVVATTVRVPEEIKIIPTNIPIIITFELFLCIIFSPFLSLQGYKLNNVSGNRYIFLYLNNLWLNIELKQAKKYQII